MNDQARGLRELMEDKREIKSQEIETKESGARVISVSSGKGGVGKTNFAVNLSISLQRLGYKVVIIDADIGLGNIEILLGITSGYNFTNIISNGLGIMDIISPGPLGLGVISGGSGLKELSLLSEENLSLIIKELTILQKSFDYIIIDTGAGISPMVMDFLMSSKETIVVTTPDPTSIMDSYVLIKALSLKAYDGDLHIITNMVKNKKEALEVFAKINGACKSFLQLEVDHLGYIERTDIVSTAVRNQIPFTISSPRSTITNRFERIALDLAKTEEVVEVSFAQRLMNIFKMR